MMDDESLEIPQSLLVQLPDGQIEELRLDDYLKGVVPTEMGLQKPPEALKAQAIASRSYAVTTRRHAADGFDVCTTTHCQVWKPKNRYPESDRAVDETAGLVAIYNHRIVATPFFGNCDGQTRNSEDVWSGALSYCRGVPCICGYPKLYGHGVGMCQRGAAAMAQRGANAEEILTHYYTGVEIARATSIPRTGFRRSVILGRVVDGQGQPRGDLRLILSGAGTTLKKGTTSDGRFWFTKLPAGKWVLEVKDRPIRHTDLYTDGRNTVELEVVVHDLPALSLLTVPLGHPRQLIGTLGYDGIPVTVFDPTGSEQTLLSGSAPDFGPGGFIATIGEPGTYQVCILDQNFDVTIGKGGLWVQFISKPA